jgi:hypothetical protein
MTGSPTDQRVRARLVGLLAAGVVLLAGCGAGPMSAASQPPAPSISVTKGTPVVHTEPLQPTTHFTLLTSVPTPSVPVKWATVAPKPKSATVVIAVEYGTCNPPLGVHVVESTSEVKIGVYAKPQGPGFCAGADAVQAWKLVLAEPLGSRHIVKED